jgi:two-component system LytT family response regulator
MDPVRVLIVEDERASRKLMRTLLEREPIVQITAECANGEQAIAALKQQIPDALFVDVQMPGLDGFDVVSAIPEDQLPVTVFVTAYGEHALRAFEVHAFDYLLKPFDEDRFHAVLRRVLAQVDRMRRQPLDQRLSTLMEHVATHNRPEFDRIAVREAGRVLFVKTDRIDWVEAADNYVCLHCGGEVHTLRDTMMSLESRLDPTRFVRIHRSSIVNIDRIRELQPWFRGDYRVILQDGHTLILSRNFRERLRQRLFFTV